MLASFCASFCLQCRHIIENIEKIHKVCHCTNKTQVDAVGLISEGKFSSLIFPLFGHPKQATRPEWRKKQGKNTLLTKVMVKKNLHIFGLEWGDWIPALVSSRTVG